MKYNIEFTSKARKAFIKLPEKEKLRIQVTLEILSENPRPPAARRLQGREGYRVRVGDYRIIYSIEDGVLVVWILGVAHRREVYRR